MKREVVIFFAYCFLCLSVFAQVDSLRHERNKRIADSLYYVHTIKPMEDSIKNAHLKEIKIEKNNATKRLKEIKLNIDTSSLAPIVIPSSTLYQNTWLTTRVKNGNVTLKDLPDEIVLRLLGKNGNDEFCFPYKGVKTSGYGWRWNRPHTGLDIALNTGDKVYAAFDGIVRVAKNNGGYGNMVLIRHYNNLETLYGHLSQIKVKAGQKVKAGEVIGLGGSTGRSTGPHLHFECRLLYACIDPEWIVDIQNYKLKTPYIKVDKSYFGISSSSAIADSKHRKSKLTKVDKLMKGTKYVSSKEFNQMIASKEKELSKPVKINNQDKSTWRYYHVKPGDSVESICKKYRISKEDIVSINHIKDDEIEIGQRIRVR